MCRGFKPGGVIPDVHHSLMPEQEFLHPGGQLRRDALPSTTSASPHRGGGLRKRLGHTAGEHQHRLGIVLAAAAGAAAAAAFWSLSPVTVQELTTMTPVQPARPGS